MGLVETFFYGIYHEIIPNSHPTLTGTPTADAFLQAATEFDRHAKSDVQIAFVITDGVPSNNWANTGGVPEWWYIDKKEGYDPSLYATEAVPEAAWVLKDGGRRVILVGVR
jgi:hypothetical protein